MLTSVFPSGQDRCCLNLGHGICWREEPANSVLATLSLVLDLGWTAVCRVEIVESHKGLEGVLEGRGACGQGQTTGLCSFYCHGASSWAVPSFFQLPLEGRSSSLRKAPLQDLLPKIQCGSVA